MHYANNRFIRSSEYYYSWNRLITIIITHLSFSVAAWLWLSNWLPIATTWVQSLYQSLCSMFSLFPAALKHDSAFSFPVALSPYDRSISSESWDARLISCWENCNYNDDFRICLKKNNGIERTAGTVEFQVTSTRQTISDIYQEWNSS